MFSRFKLKSEFNRNVATLMTGTTIAQAIPIAISPILTRIYTPEDFGVFALYMSIVTILSVIATARYELAILLPKRDDDAIAIMVLSTVITLFVSLLTLLLLSIFNAEITSLLGNEQISPWLYLISLSILLTGLYRNLTFWHNRKKYYRVIAKNRVMQSGTTSATNLGFGFGAFGGIGLILGTVIGQIISTTLLFKSMWRENRETLFKIKKIKIFALAKRFKNFPKFDIIASLSSISAQQVIHILFNILYGATVAGYYYLTQRILGLPITFISSAILDVFKEVASKDYKKYGNAKKIYISTFKKLFLLGFVPSLLIYIFATDIFGFVFGESWRVSGEYAEILAPMLFLRFVSSPLSFMLYIGEKQLLNLYTQFALFLMVLFSFYLSETTKESVYLIAISYSIFYLVHIILSSKIAGVFNQSTVK